MFLVLPDGSAGEDGEVSLGGYQVLWLGYRLRPLANHFKASGCDPVVTPRTPAYIAVVREGFGLAAASAVAKHFLAPAPGEVSRLSVGEQSLELGLNGRAVVFLSVPQLLQRCCFLAGVDAHCFETVKLLLMSQVKLARDGVAGPGGEQLLL